MITTMFKNKKKNFEVVSNTKHLLISIITIIIVLLFSSTFMMIANFNNTSTLERESNYKNYLNELTNANNLLVNEANKYVTTGDEIYYNNYIEELYTTKTREQAVKNLLDLGVTSEEEEIITQTLENSNYLALTYIAAFDLISAGNYEGAQELIFSNYCNSIREKVSDSYQILNDGISERLDKETKNTIRTSIVSYVINLIIVIAVIILSVMLFMNFYTLRDNADVDQLTGLQNRNKYKEKINALIDKQPDKYGALIYCDIDNLRFINERYGLNDGDKYIVGMANSLKVFEDVSSVLARPSGDEFVIYLHDFNSKKQIMDYIYSKLKEAKNSYFITSKGVEEKVRFSAGVSIYPADSNEVDYLLNFADYALQNMKKTSKGEVGYYDKKKFDNSTFLLKNKGYLDELIENERLDFALQPIVDARTYEIYAYEALMRPQTEMIDTPFLLLQLAKSESKLDKIERLVIKKVLEKISKNTDKLKDCLVFINSIADQVLSKEELENYKNQYPDLLENVIVEVTEQEYVGESLLKAKTDTLRQFVSGIALDDYGSGYSNEFTLLSGIYDIIKIDMQLIRDIDIDPKRQEIVKSILKVAEYNKYKVLAEGVETENEVKILLNLGVDYFQGYYFGKPDLEVKPLSAEVLEKIKKL